MYGYINGKITDIEASYVILENNGIGYLIYVPNPYGFMMEREYTIYTYTKVAEDEYTLYGFKTKEEKELFLKLISVKGLGPKMALPMLATGSISMIEEAIETENINYLKKFPKIGDKLAKQMVLDLKGKLEVGGMVVDSTTDEVYEALLALGYKDKDVKNIIGRVNKEASIEEQIKEALRLMIK